MRIVDLEILAVERRFKNLHKGLSLCAVFCGVRRVSAKVSPVCSIVHLVCSRDRAVRHIDCASPAAIPAAEDFSGKISIYARRNPRRARPDGNILCRNIRRDDLLQRLYVCLIRRVDVRQTARLFQLCPNVAGKIHLRRLPAFVRLLIGQALRRKLPLHGLLVRSHKPCNHRDIHAACLVDRRRHAVRSRVNVAYDLVWRNGVLREDRGLFRRLGFCIIVFQCKDERRICVLLDDFFVCRFVHRAVFLYEIIVHFIQFCPRCLDLLRRGVVKLKGQQFPPGIPKRDRALKHFRLFCAQIQLHQLAVLILIQLSALRNKTSVLRLAFGRADFFADFRLNFSLRRLRRVVHAPGDLRERFLNLLSEVPRLRFHGQSVRPIHRSGLLYRAEHHFRMVPEISVRLLPNALILIIIVHVTECLSGVCCSGRALLKHQNIRDNVRSGIGLERSVRQTDRAEQVGPLHHVLAHGAVSCVHRIARRDKAQHAARTHLINGFCEEIVVNGACHGLWIGFVEDRIVPERHIANGEIHVVVRDHRRFKSLNNDLRVRIKRLCNVAGHFIQFHHRQAFHIRQKGSGHGPGKIADTARRLQHTATRKAKRFKPVVHRADHFHRREMRVRRGLHRGFPLRFAEQSLQLPVLLCPIFLVAVKGVRNSAPSNIPRKHRLFLRRRHTVFAHHRTKRLNGCDIGFIAGLFAVRQLQALFRNDVVRALRRYGIRRLLPDLPLNRRRKVCAWLFCRFRRQYAIISFARAMFSGFFRYCSNGISRSAPLCDMNH